MRREAVDTSTVLGTALCVIALMGQAMASAVPIRLTVRPHGTNHLQLTISPTKPEVLYSIMARTNAPGAYWLQLTWAIGSSNGTETLDFDFAKVPAVPGLNGFSIQNLSHWLLVAGSGEDSDGDGLPDIYEDLVTSTDPFSGDTGNTGVEDGYKDLDGDNWSNLQELSKAWNPLEWNQPPAPAAFAVSHFTNGTVLLKWSHLGSALPEYFLVERAERRLRLPQPEAAPLPGQPRTRRRPLGAQRPVFETGPFVEIARVPPKAGQTDYSYIDTNSYQILVKEPIFQVRAQYDPPRHAVPTHVSELAIRGTIRRVVARQTTDGYELAVEHPVPFARYLLLCRPRGEAQWIASGYFISGTNDAPVLLHAAPNGLLAGPAQRPMPMPDVKFVLPNPNLEFTAGSGEDSDGDGLPDIYEVLVTRTDPAKADTRSTGILDGYKDLDGDGWSNLEEFRRRTDPLRPDRPPAPVELKQPALVQVYQTPLLKTDLRYEPRAAIRRQGQMHYEDLTQPLPLLYQGMNDPQRTRANFDLRIAWQIPDEPRPAHHGGP